MVKGRLDRKASTATGYCWLVWDKGERRKSRLGWVPPCRKELERDTDYSIPEKPLANRSIGRKTVSPKKRQEDLFGVT